MKLGLLGTVKRSDPASNRLSSSAVALGCRTCLMRNLPPQNPPLPQTSLDRRELQGASSRKTQVLPVQLQAHRAAHAA